MKIYTLMLGEMANCTYVVENGIQAILIDPSWDMTAIYDLLKEKDLKPVAVFFTHGHYDHLTDVEELLKKYNIKGYMEESDVSISNLPEVLLQTYKGNKTFNIAGLKVEVYHTPGHSRGSVCIKIDNVLFTGDTLFVGSCGRTDLPGSDASQMIKSLKKISAFPPDTVIYTGHSYGTKGGFKSTIAQELKTNDFLKFAAQDSSRLEDMF